jgi:hypothetical protein
MGFVLLACSMLFILGITVALFAEFNVIKVSHITMLYVEKPLYGGCVYTDLKA